MLYKILFSSYSDYLIVIWKTKKRIIIIINVFNTTNFEKVVLNNFTPHHLFTNE